MNALIAAVQMNEARRAAAILASSPELKAHLNEGDPDFHFGATPLLLALEKRNREMVDLLLAAGADINARSNWWAGSFGVLDSESGLEDFLIERGAFVDVHAAARLGRVDRLKELVEADPQAVRARGGDGQTPLHFASSIEIAGYLLDRGADIDARDIDHESTAAQYMVRGRQEVARYLVARGCRTDILMAAALGDIELVRRHLERDPASIRTSVSEEYFPMQGPRAGGSIYIWTLGPSRTAHMVAREFGHEEIVRLLMDRSPAEFRLAMACELGEEAAIEGLRVAIVEERRRIEDAAEDNRTNAVRLMLLAGWPVDVRGQEGSTALHWAGFHGNADMAALLLEHGASLDDRSNDWGSTPLEAAIYGSVHGWHCKTGEYARTVETLLGAGSPAPRNVHPNLPPEVAKVLRRHGL
jgi:ankyrin repeat protein